MIAFTPIMDWEGIITEVVDGSDVDHDNQNDSVYVTKTYVFNVIGPKKPLHVPIMC